MNGICVKMEDGDLIRLSDEIEFYFQDGEKVIIFNRYTKKSHCISRNEYLLLQMLVGLRTIDDLALLLPGISRDALEKTLLGFYRRGFAEIIRPDGRSYQKYRAKARGRCLFRPIPFFDAHPRFRDFIYNALVCGSPIVFILGLMAFINAPFGLKLPRSIFELAFALVALILSLFIHEFSHAAVAHKKGALPAEIGVKLSGLFIPCTYVIYAGIKTVAEPRDRLLIFTAGVMSHGLFLGLAAILHRIFNLTPLVYIFYINLIALLLNAVPLPGTDGYSVLREYRRKNKKDTGK